MVEQDASSVIHDTSLTRNTLERQALAQERRGARNVHVIRALLGVLLGVLVLIAGPSDGDGGLAQRGLYMSLALSASALMFLIYLRNTTPPTWLAFFPPPIDVGAITLLALAYGGVHSPFTALYFLLIVVNGLMLRQGPMLFTVVCITGAQLALNLVSQDHLDRLSLGLLILAAWLVALTTAGIIEAGKRLTLEALRQQDERNSVLRTFGQHVSPQVVDALLRQGDALESSLRHVSVMFLDIRGFTTLSESKRPEEVVDLLNDLFAFMIDEINAHHGIINKFLGDGFMAVFGAPISSGEDARNSVAAARAILVQLERRIQDQRLPPLRVGIGIHHGEAVTGSVGSLERKEYTLIGDVVNVASRVEGLNKQFASQLLVTEAVYDLQHEPPEPVARHQDVQLKGRRDTVTVYQLA